MVWELEETEEFEKQYHKLPPDIKTRFEKQFRKVEENPFGIGKTLGYPWFRELKNDKFRVYYLVYDQQVIVLFVGVSEKKSQQLAIDIIKHNLVVFKEFIENRRKEFK